MCILLTACWVIPLTLSVKLEIQNKFSKIMFSVNVLHSARILTNKNFYMVYTVRLPKQTEPA